jgi:hypothetical protein
VPDQVAGRVGIDARESTERTSVADGKAEAANGRATAPAGRTFASGERKEPAKRRWTNSEVLVLRRIDMAGQARITILDNDPYLAKDRSCSSVPKAISLPLSGRAPF